MNLILIKILAIVGPTATKKSEFAIKIAKQINGEIISADSMQIYKEMNIATAKPSLQDRQKINHYMIDCVDLESSFSVSDYVDMADRCLLEIVSKNKKPILVGGTGLYIDSFLNEIKFDKTLKNEQIRSEILADLNKFGSEFLFNKLKTLNFEDVNKIHPNNVNRVVRALEKVLIANLNSDESETSEKLNDQKKMISLKIGLNFLNRQNLYDRINHRVDLMIENGLLNEVQLILNKQKQLNKPITASQAIGYKEFEPYFYKNEPLLGCIEKLKQNTRKFAKRQITWFKRDKQINWFYLDEMKEDRILKNILNLCKEFFK